MPNVGQGPSMQARGVGVSLWECVTCECCGMSGLCGCRVRVGVKGACVGVPNLNL